MQGKMGVNIDEENKLHLYYDVEIQIEEMLFTLKLSSANIKLIVVDNVAYADTTLKETSNGVESTKRTKRQGSLE